MKNIAIGVGFLLIAAISQVSAENAGTKPVANDALQTVSVGELPSRAADLVRMADAKNRQEVACQVVRTAVERSPDATAAIVRSVCIVLPDSAPEIAAAAVSVQPARVLSIAQAAAKVSPRKAGEIVYTLCNYVPKQYRTIAETVGRIVPSASTEIVKSVAAAVPDIKPAVQQTLDSTTASGLSTAPSVDRIIAQAEQRNSMFNQTASVAGILGGNSAPAEPAGLSGQGGGGGLFGFFWRVPIFIFHRAPQEHNWNFSPWGRIFFIFWGRGHDDHGDHDGGGRDYCRP